MAVSGARISNVTIQNSAPGNATSCSLGPAPEYSQNFRNTLEDAFSSSLVASMQVWCVCVYQYNMTVTLSHTVHTYELY